MILRSASFALSFFLLIMSHVAFSYVCIQARYGENCEVSAFLLVSFVRRGKKGDGKWNLAARRRAYLKRAVACPA